MIHRDVVMAGSMLASCRSRQHHQKRQAYEDVAYVCIYLFVCVYIYISFLPVVPFVQQTHLSLLDLLRVNYIGSLVEGQLIGKFRTLMKRALVTTSVVAAGRFPIRTNNTKAVVARSRQIWAVSYPQLQFHATCSNRAVLIDQAAQSANRPAKTTGAKLHKCPGDSTLFHRSCG